MNKFISSMLVSAFLSFSAQADLVDEAARFLSQDSLKGRRYLTAGNIKAREWILQKMVELKVEPAGENGSYLQNFSRGANLIGIVRPKNIASTELPTVLMGAHYDHVRGCDKTRLAKSKVCNGAADNAAAVAAILGSLQELSESIHSPVAVVFWDAEEAGLLGSKAFVKNPTFDMSSLRLYINLDIIGLNLFRGLESHSFVIGAETGGEKLVEDVRIASQREPVKFHQITYAFGHGRSDMSSFIRNGDRIPVVFFSDGDGKVYHTNADEYENLNMNKVRSVSSTIGKLAVEASKAEKQYLYMHPRIIPILDVGLPKYQDAVTMQQVIREVLAIGETNLITDKTLHKIQGSAQKLDQLVDQGPEYFGKGDGYKVGKIVQHLLKTSRQLDFIP